MAMSKRSGGEKQEDIWIAHTELAVAPGHPFYKRLNELLEGSGFDELVEGLCARFYHARLGRPSLRPGVYFRALLVGYFDRDDFVFAGKVGTGFDTKLLLDLRARLDKLEIPKAPFTKAKGLPRIRAHWVLPEIVVQVAFIEWTVHGKLRHPRLLGIRHDKSPREVVRETW